MNYIKRLQSERQEHAQSALEISDEIQNFLRLLSSDKFNGVDLDGTRKDWISVSDVLNIVIPLRNSASALAQDLARK